MARQNIEVPNNIKLRVKDPRGLERVLEPDDRISKYFNIDHIEEGLILIYPSIPVNSGEEEEQNLTRPDGTNIECNEETVLLSRGYKKPSKYFLEFSVYIVTIAIPILLLYFKDIRFAILGMVIMAIFRGILLYRDYLRQYSSDI
ncbi:hypothetical protein RclHR1_07680007 [Rhizophagus clarus]|uniref:Uncharacterized protein n=1 Tax=Rhizophagus clarus TaxID=94130 RepID=A0A2Z6S4C6_9GLOM|nr:hypothetical protein RclHR1_07680007 [Rhizophagus clarus]